MKLLLCICIMLGSAVVMSSTKNCSNVYKKKYQSIKAYTLVKLLETKTLCSFHVIYDQNEETGDILKGDKIYDQIIISKNKNTEIASKNVLKRADFDVCEHSEPINNEINCYSKKNLFSIIAKSKREKVFKSEKLDI